MGRPPTSKPKQCLNCGTTFMVKPSRWEREKCCKKKCSNEYRNKHGMSEETKRKISEAKGGIKKDKRICVECGKEFEVESWRKNRFHNKECSMRHIGKRSHSNTYRKLLPPDDLKILSANKKQQQTLKKRFADGDLKIWNKDLTKENDERVAKYVKTQTEIRNTEGPDKEAWKAAMSKGQVKAHAAGKYPFKFTKPEKVTWAHLESLGLTVKPYSEKSDDDPENTWYHQYPFFDAFVPDFACPGLRGIIEVDGCMIHGHDLSKCKHRTAKYGWTKIAVGNQKRDRRKHSMYHRKGWKWANVWECEADLGDFHRIEQYLLGEMK